MLRIVSSLPDDVELLASEVIGACIEVHRELGAGMLEVAYQRAVAIELGLRGISHDVQRQVPILFKGQCVCHQRVDLVVNDRIVLELKAVERLAPLHAAQAISYLRALRLRLALLVNFNVPSLTGAIRRIVL